MMTVTQSFKCASCRAPLPQNHVGPCPKCGKEGREITVVASDSVEVSDRVEWQTRREYYQKNPKVLAVVIAITVLSPLLGFFLVDWAGVVAGLALGGIAYLIGPRALTKIIEKNRG